MGTPAAALAACSRGDRCSCAIDLGALTEDLAEVGKEALISDWDVEVIPETIAAVAMVLASVGERADDDVADRLASWSERLGAIAANGSSLASVDEFQ
jgi:hypothetical protein